MITKKYQDILQVLKNGIYKIKMNLLEKPSILFTEINYVIS